MQDYELIETKEIDMHHFKMVEGKFKQLATEEYIYANISTFETSTYEESEIRVYKHSFDTMCNIEDYEIHEIYDNESLCSYLKSEILKTHK